MGPWMVNGRSRILHVCRRVTETRHTKNCLARPDSKTTSKITILAPKGEGVAQGGRAPKVATSVGGHGIRTLEEL